MQLAIAEFARNVLSHRDAHSAELDPDTTHPVIHIMPEHPWFIATQAHPELKSRPNRPHPLFRGFIEAALKYAEQNQAFTSSTLR